MKNIALFFLLFLSMPCTAQVDISAFSSGAAEGVTYYLPDTRVDITVEARCIKRIPGEFARFADRFLHMNDAIQEESTDWELTNINVCTSGVPNKGKAFTVKLGNSVAANMRLNPQGIISSINCDVDEPVKVVPEEKKTKRVDSRTYFTEEIMQATSTAKMAELVAKEIYAVRESKLAITRGHADNMPKDGLSMQLVLDELNLQEKTLTELFTGRSDTVSYSCDIKFTPREDSDTARAVLFRFSRKLGILERDDLAGAPVYYDFYIEKNVAPAETEPAKKKKEVKKEGICYILPGRALMKIYIPGETFFEETVSVAQFGTVEVLAKNVFSRGADTKVVFDTATGNIISIDK